MTRSYAFCNNHKGFTIIELLVSVIISSILILMIGAISTIALRSYDDLRGDSDMFSDAFFGLARLRQAVRMANNTTVNSYAGNNTLAVGPLGAELLFYLNGTNFVCNDTNEPVGPYNPRIIMPGVDVGTFYMNKTVNFTTNTTKIDLHIQGQIGNETYKAGNETYNITTNVTCRNY